MLKSLQKLIFVSQKCASGLPASWCKTRMTRSRRAVTGSDGASTSVTPANMASRVETLETNLQTELRDLKDQLLGAQEAVSSPEVVSSYLTKINEFEKKVMHEIKSVREEIQNMDRKLLEHKQEYALNTLVFNGIPEKDGAGDYDQVCKIIRNYLKVEINMSDIDYCFRLGRRAEVDGRIRPIAVRFVNRWYRNKIFNEKKKLKGTKVVLNEFLISSTLSLYKSVRDKLGARKCWTWRGGIYASGGNGKTRIRKISDLDNLHG